MSDYTSHWVDFGGATHYVAYAGPAGAPPLVAVHGLGGSHANWAAVGPALAERRRVYALDLAGHGRTRPDARHTDVHANQRLLDRFVEDVVGEPVVLMGNSMGGLISILQASRNPASIAALALVAPAVPDPSVGRRDPQVVLNFLAYATPGLGAAVLLRRRRLTPEQQVADTLSLCCADPARVPSEAVERAVALARERQSYHHVERAFLGSARSVLRTLAQSRQYQAHMRAVRAPVLVLQGEQDRLVPVAAVRAAVAGLPHWQLVTAPDLGHVPMLEAPAWTVEQVHRWQDRIGLRSGKQHAGPG